MVKKSFEEKIISVRTGQLINKTCLPANLLNGQYTEWKYMLIEEPFDLTNTARSVFDQRVFSQIKNVFKKSAEVYGSFKNVDFLFEKKFTNFNNLNGRYDDGYD